MSLLADMNEQRRQNRIQAGLPTGQGRLPPLRWRFGAKRYAARSVAFHVDGHDLVHITEIDADGNAFVIVYASSHPDAEVLFTGRINVSARP